MQQCDFSLSGLIDTDASGLKNFTSLVDLPIATPSENEYSLSLVLNEEQ
jgi:hypothetical protein